jgi:hypothetical protein
MTPRRFDEWRKLRGLMTPVHGHRFLPNGGQIIPHWWPSFLPTGGHRISPPEGVVGRVQVRGLTPLPGGQRNGWR